MSSSEYKESNEIQTPSNNDIETLFENSESSNHLVLDIDTPKAQKVISTLPQDFQIKTMSDIETLEENVAFKYTKGIRLYRGHESKEYKIESTIVRLSKEKKIPSSNKEVIDAEKKGYVSFCKNVFKEAWLQNKLDSTDEKLFKMSIGRHLGLPCRLIDVTASLRTAIWFAVMNPKFYNKDGEIILIVLDKEAITPMELFSRHSKINYSHEPFVADSLNELPLGEQRRFVQNGHFIWVDDKSLLTEEQVILDSAFEVCRYTIPWYAKIPLAIQLYRDVYSGCAYQSEMAKIRENMYK